MRQHGQWNRVYFVVISYKDNNAHINIASNHIALCVRDYSRSEPLALARSREECQDQCHASSAPGGGGGGTGRRARRSANEVE